MFAKKKALVIGDFLLDVYTLGDVQRISPEAPVPVLKVCSETRRPGGAGNVILNLISLGIEVIAMGRVGEDDAGCYFLETLSNERVDIRGIIQDPNYQTPIKNRMIAAGQQIVRIDRETAGPLSSSLEKEFISMLPQLLDEVSVVTISDYAKGLLSPTLLEEVIGLARAREIPVIVDPKGLDFTRYHGATLLKPNLSEAIAAAGLGMEATLEEVAAEILDEIAVEILMITRSKEGISIFTRKGRLDFPAHVHEIKDVTGAGDTVLAVITAAMVSQMDLSEAAKLANIAAGVAIERIGCARISVDDLSERLEKRRRPIGFLNQ